MNPYYSNHISSYNDHSYYNYNNNCMGDENNNCIYEIYHNNYRAEKNDNCVYECCNNNYKMEKLNSNQLQITKTNEIFENSISFFQSQKNLDLENSPVLSVNATNYANCYYLKEIASATSPYLMDTASLNTIEDPVSSPILIENNSLKSTDIDIAPNLLQAQPIKIEDEPQTFSLKTPRNLDTQNDKLTQPLTKEVEKVSLRFSTSGIWSLEQDQQLKELVLARKSKNKIGRFKINWKKIADLIPGKTNKQCKSRWYNLLKREMKISNQKKDQN